MNFTLGSMYWINPRCSLDELREDMRRIADNRIDLLRTFIPWEYVEAEKGVFDFSIFDRFFTAAEEAHLAVMPTLIFYLPFFMVVEQTESGNDDGARRYGVAFAGFDLRFIVEDGALHVREVVPLDGTNTEDDV